jgi:hypothetical protein
VRIRRTCAAAALPLALVVAGCGGGGDTAATTPAPKLPRSLAQAWAQQADQISAALAAGDGCTAQTQAAALRTQVTEAVSERKVARRFVEPLVGAVSNLPDRIACTPPAPPPDTKHDRPHGHGKHGHDKHDGGD